MRVITRKSGDPFLIITRMVEHYKNLSLENLSEIIDGELRVEEWRDVKGYEGVFKVSSFGRLKKLPCMVQFHYGEPRMVGEKILLPTPDIKGYLKTRLFVTKENFRAKRVHVLVAEAFLGERPEWATQVNHLNGIKDCNYSWNLEWSNNSKNIKHAWDTGLFNPNVESTTRSNTFLVLHTEYGVFLSLNEAAKILNIARITLKKMVTNNAYNYTKFIAA